MACTLFLNFTRIIVRTYRINYYTECMSNISSEKTASSKNNLQGDNSNETFYNCI
jgi:hypothetical protein